MKSNQLPDPVEWDFSKVPARQQTVCMSWEHARSATWFSEWFCASVAECRKQAPLIPMSQIPKILFREKVPSASKYPRYKTRFIFMVQPLQILGDQFPNPWPTVEIPTDEKTCGYLFMESRISLSVETSHGEKPMLFDIKRQLAARGINLQGRERRGGVSALEKLKNLSVWRLRAHNVKWDAVADAMQEAYGIAYTPRHLLRMKKAADNFLVRLFPKTVK